VSPGQRYLITTTSVTQALIDVNGNATGINKIGGFYLANQANQATNGVLGILDASVTVPSLTQLSIGKDRATTNNYDGWIRTFSYYPTRLPNTTLQSLTK
jgi:hypothetical protein